MSVKESSTQNELGDGPERPERIALQERAERTADQAKSSPAARTQTATSARPQQAPDSGAPTRWEALAASVCARAAAALRAGWGALREQLADRWLLITLAIAVGAFVIRIVGASYGLPYLYYWDEPTIVNRAMRMGSGDLNPHFFYYPGLSFYVTFIAEVCLYVVGHLLHVYPSVRDYAAAYFTSPTPFYLLGRTLGALLGAATVVVCYLVGKRFFSPIVGVLAAALLAVSPVSVLYPHFVTNDVPMAFFTLLAYLWLWNVYRSGRPRDYVLAGITIGLGIATKYLPVVELPSLVLAHVLFVHRERGRWRPEWRDLGPVALGLGAAVATFCVTSPYDLLDWRNALHDLTIQAQLSSAAGSSTTPRNFGPYLTSMLPWSIGWPAYLVALAGLVALLWTRGERRLQLVLLASFPVLYFLMIGNERQAWDRWLVSLEGFLALSAAALVTWGARQVPALWKRLAPTLPLRSGAVAGGALTVAMVILLVPPLWSSVHYDAYLVGPDPRTQAVEWFTAHVPSGTTVALQPLLDRYYDNAPIMTESQLAKLDQQFPAGQGAVRQEVDAYFRSHAFYPDVPFVYDLTTLQAEGVRYVVLSSMSYHQSGDNAAEDRFYAALQHAATSVLVFSPPPGAAQYNVQMPTITIYALPASTR